MGKKTKRLATLICLVCSCVFVPDEEHKTLDNCPSCGIGILERRDTKEGVCNARS